MSAEAKLEELNCSYEFRYLTQARSGFGKMRRELIEQLKQEEIMEEHAVIAFVCTKSAADKVKIDEFRKTADSLIQQLRTVCTLK